MRARSPRSRSEVGALCARLPADPTSWRSACLTSAGTACPRGRRGGDRCTDRAAKRIALRVATSPTRASAACTPGRSPTAARGHVHGLLVAVLASAIVPQLRPISWTPPEMTGVVLAAGAMFAVGLIDDVRDMSAPAKMAGRSGRQHPVLQWRHHVRAQDPAGRFFVLTPGIIPLITAAWVIALTNAVNLIDGLDGLAAGVVRDRRRRPGGSTGSA